MSGDQFPHLEPNEGSCPRLPEAESLGLSDEHYFDAEVAAFRAEIDDELDFENLSRDPDFVEQLDLENEFDVIFHQVHLRLIELLQEAELMDEETAETILSRVNCLPSINDFATSPEGVLGLYQICLALMTNYLANHQLDAQSDEDARSVEQIAKIKNIIGNVELAHLIVKFDVDDFLLDLPEEIKEQGASLMTELLLDYFDEDEIEQAFEDSATLRAEEITDEWNAVMMRDVYLADDIQTVEAVLGATFGLHDSNKDLAEEFIQAVVAAAKPEADIPADENDPDVRARRIELHSEAQWQIIEGIANGDEQLLDIAEQLRRKYEEFFQ